MLEELPACRSTKALRTYRGLLLTGQQREQITPDRRARTAPSAKKRRAMQRIWLRLSGISIHRRERMPRKSKVEGWPRWGSKEPFVGFDFGGSLEIDTGGEHPFMLPYHGNSSMLQPIGTAGRDRPLPRNIKSGCRASVAWACKLDLHKMIEEAWWPPRKVAFRWDDFLLWITGLLHGPFGQCLRCLQNLIDRS
jgi:hypothetical protein